MVNRCCKMNASQVTDQFYKLHTNAMYADEAHTQRKRICTEATRQLLLHFNIPMASLLCKMNPSPLCCLCHSHNHVIWMVCATKIVSTEIWIITTTLNFLGFWVLVFNLENDFVSKLNAENLVQTNHILHFHIETLCVCAMHVSNASSKWIFSLLFIIRFVFHIWIKYIKLSTGCENRCFIVCFFFFRLSHTLENSIHSLEILICAITNIHAYTVLPYILNENMLKLSNANLSTTEESYFIKLLKRFERFGFMLLLVFLKYAFTKY